jgi:fibronectin type 3 domain-containing protein
MKCTRIYVIGVILLFVTVCIQGQSISDDSILVKAKVYEDSVSLRWAPSNHVFWQKLNKTGYSIERYTILRDSVLLDEKPLTVLSPAIKVLPLDRWEQLIDINDYAAVAAQAIYGSTFDLSNEGSNDISTLVNVAKEQQTRFSFALFAADMSFKVAKYAGLGLSDANIKNNETYLYRIKAPTIDSADYQYGYIYVDARKLSQLPAIKSPDVKFGDGTAMLSWDIHKYKDFYSGYFIEKSYDSINFFKINDKPIVSPYEQGNIYRKSDSLRANNEKVYYRILGIDMFGDLGEPSEVVAGKGKRVLTERAVLTGYEISKNSTLLKWTLAEDQQQNIKGFYIERSATEKGPFVRENYEIIYKSLREYDVINSFNTSYYRIITKGLNDNEKKSFPILVQKVDSIPPVKPSEIKYITSSEGEVYLSWDANEEDDLLGYRIYRSNFANSEFSEITQSPVLETNFTDYIELKNLSKNIYYKLKAIDIRYNPSDFSDILVVKKPDFVLPTPPVLKNYEITNNGVKLYWEKSYSSDVAKYIIYRKSAFEDEWKILTEKSSLNNFYLDASIAIDSIYYYKMVSVDSTDLKSKFSNSIKIKNISNQIVKLPNDLLNVKVDKNELTLSWEVQKSVDYERVILYKKISIDWPLNLYKIIAWEDGFFKEDLKGGESYYIQIEFFNGSRSELKKIEL